MLDFTSALYLGMLHPSASLTPWSALTHGRPAAVREPAGAAALERRLAALQGCEAATLLPSTLHLFWDLFGVLVREGPIAILADAAAYPIARWGAVRAVADGAGLHAFPHRNAARAAALANDVAPLARPVLLTDGFCAGCGRPAPLAEYARIARDHGGLLVIDDTQALGLLGRAPSHRAPLGSGGGGSLEWQGVRGSHILVASSLAKAFGAPLAALSGSAERIGRFVERSETRVHTSPPSIAAIAAAERALDVNAAEGDIRRLRLTALVSRFIAALGRAGTPTAGTLPFPVQHVTLAPSVAPSVLYARLRRDGITALLTRACTALSTRLTFLFTHLHRAFEVERAARAVSNGIQRTLSTPTFTL